MSVRRLAEVQPESFEFTPDNMAWAQGEIAKYPPGRQASAVIALLWRAQKQNDYWLSKPAIEKVARILDMPNIRVLEVATFYSMFNLAPVGRHYVQLCGTTPCMLRGSEGIKAVLQQRIGDAGHVSADGLFSWNEVECLGACCNAPMVQINDDYFEDLTPENFGKLMDDLAAGRPVTVGSQIGRVSSEPVGGLTALTSFYGADGRTGPWSGSTPAPGNDQSGASALPPAAAPLDDAAAHAHAAAEEAHIAQALAQLPADATPVERANAVGAKPAGLEAARSGAADDLQRIKGVGPVNERHLHGLGVFHFDQIAAWARAEIRWVGTYLAFPGRIDREQWVAQAANLAHGGAGPKDAHAHPGAAKPHGHAAAPAGVPPQAARITAGSRPAGLEAPPGEAKDSLQRISFLTAEDEKQLHAIGIYTFVQIAAWTPEEVQWVGSHLSSPGRIEREQWPAQASELVEAEGSGRK